MKILALDDNLATLDILSHLLGEEGHHVQIVDCSSKALTILESKNFDIIVSDIHMPGLNGIDFAIEVRKTNSLIPIVFFTSDINVQKTHGSTIRELRFAKLIDDKNYSRLLIEVREIEKKCQNIKSKTTY